MKILTCSALVTLLLSATVVWADNGQKPASTPTSPKLATATAGGANALLSDAEIDAFKTEGVTDDGKRKIQFMAALSVPSLNAQEKKKFERSGKVPVRITCTLEEIKVTQSKPLVKRLSGRVQFYLLDSDDKVVFRKAMHLEKMCAA
jgi:hypothetical protein